MIEAASFTSDHTDSHAMGFAEYCGTYLTGWCNVAWGEWDVKARMADAKKRFVEYTDGLAAAGTSGPVDGVKELHQKAWKQFSNDTPSRNKIEAMIPYHLAWKLVPDQYRWIDQFLTADDVARAFGRKDGRNCKDANTRDNSDPNAEDGDYFCVWQDWAAKANLPQAVPIGNIPATAAPGGAPEKLTPAQLNKLARSLTPSWFIGHELFGVDYEVLPGDDPNIPKFHVRGSETFNRIHRAHWGYLDLPKIRRILANIPTYMIFDDHEVTDDWNITYNWQKNTRGNPLGRGVIRNGLAAFTLFQYWGNDPRACRTGTFASDVLDKIELMFLHATEEHPGPDAAAVTWLEQAFDLSILPLAPPPPLNPGTRMQWDFKYTGPQFEVLALDSRTWRGAEIDANDQLVEPFFPDASATLMTEQAMLLQIPETPPAGVNPNGVCIVIAAAPFLGFPPVESVAQPLVNLKDMLHRTPDPPFMRWKRGLLFGRVAHDPEPWGFRPKLFEATAVPPRLCAFGNSNVARDSPPSNDDPRSPTGRRRGDGTPGPFTDDRRLVSRNNELYFVTTRMHAPLYLQGCREGRRKKSGALDRRQAGQRSDLDERRSEGAAGAFLERLGTRLQLYTGRVVRIGTSS